MRGDMSLREANNMKGPKTVTIRWEEDEELYKKFIKAKTDYDKPIIEAGGNKTSNATYARMLITKALKEEEEKGREAGGDGRRN